MNRRGGEIQTRKKRSSGIRSEGKALSNGVLLVLMALGFIGVFMLLRPFIAPIVLALFLVTIAYPVHKRVRQLFRGRKTITAIVMVIGVFLVVVIPFLLVSAAIVQQGIEVAQHLQNWITSGGPKSLVEGVQNFHWEIG